MASTLIVAPLRSMAQRAATGDEQAIETLARHRLFRDAAMLTHFVWRASRGALTVELHDRLCDTWQAWHDAESLGQALGRMLEAA